MENGSATQVPAKRVLNLNRISVDCANDDSFKVQMTEWHTLQESASSSMHLFSLRTRHVSQFWASTEPWVHVA